MNLQELNKSLEIIAGGAGVLAESRSRSNRLSDPRWVRRMAEAKRMVTKARNGDDLALYGIREAASVSDYPLVQGDNLAREMRALYNEYPAEWRSMATVAQVPDFRAKKIFPRGTVDQAWTATPPPAVGDTSNLADQTAVSYSVDVYSNHLMINWKTLVNDDLGYFADLPSQFARGARRTELKTFTQTHWGASGPTGLTQLTSNPLLNVAGFRAAFGQIMKSVDANGEPILIDAPVLEVGSGPLAITAREVIKAVAITIHDDLTAASSTGTFNTENWISTMVSNIVVNPYVPVICSSNEDTSWCLLANSGRGAAAIEMGYLRGMTEPVLTTKRSNVEVLGGSSLPSNFGDFEGNNVEYKGWLVVGGKVRDSALGFMSNGTGS